MLTKGPAGNGRPSQEVASSGVTRPPRHHEETSFPGRRFSGLGWLSSTAGRLGVLMLTGSRNGAARRNSPAITETRRVCRSLRSLVGWDAQKRPSRRISTIQPAIRHARSRRATGECVAAAGRPPRHGTARATPTRIANAATRRDCAAMDPGTGSRSDARMASALRRCAVILRLVAHPRTPARRRGAQTTTSRKLARAVHCDRSVRELGGGRRGRLRRRLSARASMPLTYERGLALDRL